MKFWVDWRGYCITFYQINLVMKIVFLILTTFFLFIGCGQEENEEDVLTENAILYYYFDAAFGGSSCYYVIEINNDQVYIPNNEYDLSEFNSNNGSNTENNVKVSYRLTDDKIDRCYHKDGFIDNPTNIIEIISLEKT